MGGDRGRERFGEPEEKVKAEEKIKSAPWYASPALTSESRSASPFDLRCSGLKRVCLGGGGWTRPSARSAVQTPKRFWGRDSLGVW